MPVYTSDDLITADHLMNRLDRISEIWEDLDHACGESEEPYSTTLNDAGVTGPATPAAGSTITLSAPSGGLSGTWADLLPPCDFLLLEPRHQTVTCASVLAGDTYTLQGVAFTAVTGAAGANQFDRSGSDSQTATNLALAINSSTSGAVDGKFIASASGAVVTVRTLAPRKTDYYVGTVSNGTRLAITGFAYGVTNSRLFGGDAEKIRYRSIAGNVFTVEERGYDNTTPTAHANGCVVYLPSTASRSARRILQDLVGVTGDSTDPGVGDASATVIESFIRGDREQILALTTQEVLRVVVTAYFNDLRQHIASIANPVLSTEQDDSGVYPSYNVDANDDPVKVSVVDLNSYLRYINDKNTGTPFQLVPWQAAKVQWLIEGELLDNKVVFPARQTLLIAAISGGGAITAFTAGLEINRYGDNTDPEVYVQGYSAQRLRARVTTAGTGEVTFTEILAQGQDADGDYFGRPAECEIRILTPADGNTVKVHGVTFTSKTTPVAVTDFAIASGNANQTATNLASAIEAAKAANPSLENIEASGPMSVSDTFVTLSVSADDPTDTTNYLVETSATSAFDLRAGSLTAQTIASFGGGGLDGTTADSSQPGGVSADDNPRVFLGKSGGKLDMTAVGNVLEFEYGASPGSRVGRVLKIAGSSSGAGGQFILESVPDRSII